jgi:hypothetical protein
MSHLTKSVFPGLKMSGPQTRNEAHSKAPESGNGAPQPSGSGAATTAAERRSAGADML